MPRPASFQKIVDRALDGKMSKKELAELLKPEKRKLFLETCASIEIAFTKNCRESGGDTCLPDGCAMDDGEACLNPILGDGSNYWRTVTHVWMELADPKAG